MRGRSSGAKSRLRSAGYKCNLCGRKVIDAAALERHQKTVHNFAPRANQSSFKAKPGLLRSRLSAKDTVKTFDDLLKEETVTESKQNPKSSKKNNEVTRDAVRGTTSTGTDHHEKDEPANGDSQQIEAASKTNNKTDGKRKVEFECPVCSKTFNVYFTALKHIQRWHPVNGKGEKVPPNSQDLVQPVRVEPCLRCSKVIRSTDGHVCPKPPENGPMLGIQYVCTACNQTFVNLKTFDMHVAGLHSDGVDSMFFPTAIEFTNWRLEMERQTNIKYSILGQYDAKKIYRCNYGRENALGNKNPAHICPSSMIVQDFSKGIQVHFYKKHYSHTTKAYTLASKYKKYSITSFLKNPTDTSYTSAPSYAAQPDEKELYLQFKKLMESIILDAARVDYTNLKTLIEKALDMTTLLTEHRNVTPIKPKTITDKEIANELQLRSTLNKRRRSVDTFEPKPAKRSRNKSLFVQSENKLSPMIVNTFSLASNSNSDDMKSELSDDFDNRSTNSAKAEPPILDANAKVDVPAKVNTRSTRFKELESFNDSYKQFINKNFTEADIKSGKVTKSNTVKTKLGAFKPTSPKTNAVTDNKIVNILKDIQIPANDRSLERRQSISSTKAKIDIATNTPKVNKEIAHVTPKVTPKVSPKETPNLTPKTTPKDTHKMNPKETPTETPKVNPKETPKVATKETPKVTPKVTGKVNLKETPSPKTTPKTKPKVTPKISPKVPSTAFKDATNELDGTASGYKSVKNIPEFKYEVREQENDCNILVLKF